VAQRSQDICATDGREAGAYRDSDENTPGVNRAGWVSSWADPPGLTELHPWNGE